MKIKQPSEINKGFLCKLLQQHMMFLRHCLFWGKLLQDPQLLIAPHVFQRNSGKGDVLWEK